MYTYILCTVDNYLGQTKNGVTWMLDLVCLACLDGIFTMRSSYASVVLWIVLPVCLSHTYFVTK